MAANDSPDEGIELWGLYLQVQARNSFESLKGSKGMLCQKIVLHMEGRGAPSTFNGKVCIQCN